MLFSKQRKRKLKVTTCHDLQTVGIRQRQRWVMEERDEVSHPPFSVVDSQGLMLRFVKPSNIVFLLNS